MMGFARETIIFIEFLALVALCAQCAPGEWNFKAKRDVPSLKVTRSRASVVAKRGESYDLLCTANTDVRACMFQTPYGQKRMVWPGAAWENGRIKQNGEAPKECGITVDNASYTDSGRWECIAYGQFTRGDSVSASDFIDVIVRGENDQCSIGSDEVDSPYDSCNTCSCINGMVSGSCTKAGCPDEDKNKGELCANRANNCRDDLQCVEKWKGHVVGRCEDMGAIATINAFFDVPDGTDSDRPENYCPKIKITFSNEEIGHFNLTARNDQYLSKDCYIQAFNDGTAGGNKCVTASGYLDKTEDLWRQEILIDIFESEDAGRYSVYFENPHCQNQFDPLCYKLKVKKIGVFEEDKISPCARRIQSPRAAGAGEGEEMAMSITG